MSAVGYSRISTASQVDHLQTDALERAGCVRIFHEVASGIKSNRPQLEAALDFCRPGDVLTVFKLDRVSRNTAHLLGLAEDLEKRQIGLASLTEQLDTTTPGGRLLFTVLAALAQLERDVLVERTLAGLAAARARGRVGGRRPTVTPVKLAAAQAMLREERHTLAQVAEAVGVSRTALYRALRPAQDAGVIAAEMANV